MKRILEEMINLKQKEYQMWFNEVERLRGTKEHFLSPDRIYSRNKMKWCYRELQDFKYKLSQWEKQNA